MKIRNSLKTAKARHKDCRWCGARAGSTSSTRPTRASRRARADRPARGTGIANAARPGRKPGLFASAAVGKAAGRAGPAPRSRTRRRRAGRTRRSGEGQPTTCCRRRRVVSSQDKSLAALLERAAMGVVAFPNDCRALVVEPEPVQAVVLEIMLDELGCQVVGPVHSTRTALELVGQRRPSFALVEAHAPVDALAELAAGLAKVHVPFALLAIGRPRADLDRVPLLRDAPRVARPFPPREPPGGGARAAPRRPAQPARGDGAADRRGRGAPGAPGATGRAAGGPRR